MLWLVQNAQRSAHIAGSEKQRVDLRAPAPVPALLGFSSRASLLRLVKTMLEWAPRISLMPMPAVVTASDRA